MDLSRVEQQMQFIIEIDKLKQVFRQNFLTESSRKENDAEHSWHLAMIVIILSEYFPKVDLLKALKMVLIHDLIEIYAGDTFAYDEKANQGKYQREKDASVKLFGILPSDQSKELSNLWQEFEDTSSPESILANIADRIQPLTLNICSEGKMWLANKITRDKVINRNSIVFKKGPAEISEYIQQQIEKATAKGYFFMEE